MQLSGSLLLEQLDAFVVTARKLEMNGSGLCIG